MKEHLKITIIALLLTFLLCSIKIVKAEKCMGRHNTYMRIEHYYRQNDLKKAESMIKDNRYMILPAINFLLENYIDTALGGPDKQDNTEWYKNYISFISRKYQEFFNDPYPRKLAERFFSMDLEEKRVWQNAYELTVRAVELFNGGNYEEAKERFKEASEIFKELNDSCSFARSLVDIAEMDIVMGNFESGIKKLKKAIPLKTKIDDKSGLEYLYNVLAKAYLYTGDFSNAFNCYQEVLSLDKQVEDPRQKGKALEGIGEIYFLTGINSQAKYFLQEALKIWNYLKSFDGISRCRRRIGDICAQEKNLVKAESYYFLPLKIEKDLAIPESHVSCIYDYGKILLQMNKIDEALKHFEKSLAASKSYGLRLHEAMSLLEIANIELNEGNLSKAEKSFTLSRSIAESLGAKEILLLNLYGLGKLLRLRGEKEKALNILKNAAGIIEKARRDIPIKKFQYGYFSSKINIYEEMIGLLYEFYRESSAESYLKDIFEYIEMSKARSFRDRLLESKYDFQKKDHSIISKEKTLIRSISAIQSNLWRGSLSEYQKSSMMKKLNDLNFEIDSLHFSLRKNKPELGEFTFTEFSSVLRSSQEILKENEVVLEYFIGENESFLLIFDNKEADVTRIGTKKEIEKKVKDLCKSLSTSYGIDKELAHSLFNKLLGSAFEKIRSKKRFIVIPDSCLYRIPFGVLVQNDKPGRFLAQDYEIIYMPSISIMTYLKKQPEPSKVKDLLLIAPFTSYKGKKDHSFSTLFATEEEVQTLKNIFPPEKVKVLMGKEASEWAFNQMNLKDYRIIHFATHAGENPEMAGEIAIWFYPGRDAQEDGLLTTEEIMNLNIDADLVMLAGCGTATGRMIPGEGLMDLTRAFICAGARRVVATLWNVEDSATKYFMTEFYSKLSKGKSVSEALLETQKGMIEKEHFCKWWAPFVIYGIP